MEHLFHEGNTSIFASFNQKTMQSHTKILANIISFVSNLKNSFYQVSILKDALFLKKYELIIYIKKLSLLEQLNVVQVMTK